MAHDRYQQALDQQDQVQGQITALEQAIPEMRAKEAELRTQLSTRAAALDKNTDPSAGLEVLAAKDHIQAGRRTKLTEAADAYDDERVLASCNDTALRLEQAQRDPGGQEGAARGASAAVEQEKAVFDQKVAEANRAPPGGGGDRRPAGAGRAGHGSDGALGRRDGGVVPIERRVTEAVGRDVDRRAGADLRRGRNSRERARRLCVRGVVRRDGRLPRRRERQQLLGSRRVRRLPGRDALPERPRRVRAQIQHLRNYADRNSARPTSAIPRRRSGTGRTRARQRRTSTRSSPRGGRRSGR